MKKISKKHLRLNLGCGHTRYPGLLGVDNNPNAEYVDLTCDLEAYPYPFSDNSVSEILMDHVLEHLDNPLKVIQELYRISENGSVWTINTPHFSCNWLHPGHKSAISTMLFDYFIPGTDDYYGKCEFKVLEKRLSWLRPPDPNRPNYKRSSWLLLADRVISVLANMNLGFCQRVWCYWVGGFEEIHFRVRVIKSGR